MESYALSCKPVTRKYGIEQQQLQIEESASNSKCKNYFAKNQKGVPTLIYLHPWPDATYAQIPPTMNVLSTVDDAQPTIHLAFGQVNQRNTLYH
jgi:hypothetical protein